MQVTVVQIQGYVYAFAMPFSAADELAPAAVVA